jgi:hypothetical protein
VSVGTAAVKVVNAVAEAVLEAVKAANRIAAQCPKTRGVR